MFVIVAENFKVVFRVGSAKEITAIVRKVLWEKFFEADSGKSGVNFAIAETGILNLEENEGNGRFSTTLSPVHVAVMGNFDFTTFNNY